jgi:hypothetical protein
MDEERKQKAKAAIRALLDELRGHIVPGHGGQARLAEALGVERMRLNDWFKEHRKPNSSELILIQEFLKKRRRKKPNAH